MILHVKVLELEEHQSGLGENIGMILKMKMVTILDVLE